MGIPVRPIFDHNDPEWPENESRYLTRYLRTQAIMHGVVYVSAAVFLIVIAIAEALK